jgi:hypothetical protein
MWRPARLIRFAPTESRGAAQAGAGRTFDHCRRSASVPGGLRKGERTMDRPGCSTSLSPRLLVGLAAVLLAPGLSRGESLWFRNDTTVPIVVQGACVVRGALVRGRPYLVNPGEKSPAIKLPGDKVITIYEAKVPNRMLYQEVITGGTDDQLISVQGSGMRLKFEKQRSKHSGEP